MLLAHHVVRKLMLEAALARERAPDASKFKHSLTLMRRKLPASGAVAERAVPEVVEKELVEAAAAGALTSPKGRSNPRLAKRQTKQYLPRKGNELLNLRHDWTPEIIK